MMNGSPDNCRRGTNYPHWVVSNHRCKRVGNLMPCNRVLVPTAGAILWLFTATSTWATPSGTAEEARAMLDKAVAAVRADKLKALEMFNSGEGGFKDRDLYASCANASDGIVTAHPTGKGAQLRDIRTRGASRLERKSCGRPLRVRSARSLSVAPARL